MSAAAHAARRRRVRDRRGLLLVGALVAAVAAGLYVAALISYPRISTLKGFDLGVYRMGGWLVRHDPARIYIWQLRPGISFTYPRFAALVFTPLSLIRPAELMDLTLLVSVAAYGATIWIACRELVAGSLYVLVGACGFLFAVLSAVLTHRVHVRRLSARQPA